MSISKKKYKYNPNTLSYEVVQISSGKRILLGLLWIAPSILFGLIFTVFFTQGITSPREKQLQSDLNANYNELKRIQKDLILANEVLDVIENRDEDLYRVALYAEKFPEELRKMGTGGSDRYSYLSNMTNGELIKETSIQIDKLEKRLNAQSISFRELLKLAKGKEQLLACVPAIQPVRNSELKKPVSGFGYRIDPIYKTRKMHSGMDFTADKGTEVYATGNGFIEVIESKRWGYGKSIVINHGFGYKTRYAHLSAFKVKQGQKVKRGELIGLIGSTGKSTGPHLHYEVIKNGKKVNPIGYYHSDLSPDQYEMLLEMTENSYKSLD